MLDPEVYIRRLGDTAYKVLWDGYLTARNAEHELAVDVLKFFAEKWDALPKEMQRRRFDVVQTPPELAFPREINREGETSRQWVWMVALNMGNPSNRERLLGGYQWNEQAVLRFLDETLTKEEWDFIQGVWDLLDEKLWPKAAAQYESANGTRPQKIEGTPIVTQHGTYRGGYFPARYDSVASNRAAPLQESALPLLNAAAKASVYRGFTQGRAQNFSDVISLEWSVVPSHIASVIHYITHDSYVRDANRFVGHEMVRNTIQKRIGVEYEPQIQEFLKFVANPRYDAVPEALRGPLSFLDFFKSRTVVGALALSIPNFMGDITAPLVAAAAGEKEGVRLRNLAPKLAPSAFSTVGVAALSAVNPLFAGPALAAGVAWNVHTYKTWRTSSLQKSAELRLRADNWRAQFNRELQAMASEQTSGFAHRAMQFYFFLQEYADRISSTLIWESAYRQGLAEGLAEQEAVRIADGKVRANLPPVADAERPTLLRDRRTFAAISAFYGYFSKIYNLNTRIWDEVTQEWDSVEHGAASKAYLVSRAGARTGAVMFMAFVVSEFMTGRGPEEDETTAEWALRKTATSPFLLVPVLGGYLEVAANSTWAKLRDQKPKPANARAAPSVAALERIVRAAQRAANDNRDTDQRVWDVLEVLGMGAKLPATQLRRTGEYVWNVAEGDETPQDINELMSGIIYGSRENQPKNPLTLGKE
jgi:hypothetical protein